MMKVDDFKKLGVRYDDGDDTGMLIPVKAAQLGWKIDGWKPTRCPVSRCGKVDPEFNRYVSVVYGDFLYHCGGYTRIRNGDDPIMEKDFGWARETMFEEGGAEFMLDDRITYKFKFDKEEAVAAEKMQRHFGMKDQRIGL